MWHPHLRVCEVNTRYIRRECFLFFFFLNICAAEASTGSAFFWSKTGLSFAGWDCWRVWSLFPLTAAQSSSCLRTWCTTSSTPACWTWRWAPGSMAMTHPLRRLRGKCGSASRVRRRRWASGSVACRWVGRGESLGACVFGVVCVCLLAVHARGPLGPQWARVSSGRMSPLGWGALSACLQICSLSPLVLNRGPWTGLECRTTVRACCLDIGATKTHVCQHDRYS